MSQQLAHVALGWKPGSPQGSRSVLWAEPQALLRPSLFFETLSHLAQADPLIHNPPALASRVLGPKALWTVQKLGLVNE